MSDVTRYDLEFCDGDSGRCYAAMKVSDDGEFVDWCAYDALAARLAEVEQERDEARAEARRFSYKNICAAEDSMQKAKELEVERMLRTITPEYDRGAWEEIVSDLRNQLTTLQADHAGLREERARLREERDGYKEQLTAIDRHATFESLCQELGKAKQQLAAAQEFAYDTIRKQVASKLKATPGTALDEVLNEVVRELANMPSSQDTWTKGKPTGAGWYWWRDLRNIESRWIFKVEQHPDTDVWCYREGHELLDLDDLVGGEWCRIPKPREA